MGVVPIFRHTLGREARKPGGGVFLCFFGHVFSGDQKLTYAYRMQHMEGFLDTTNPPVR